jgi:hypothetical protein
VNLVTVHKHPDIAGFKVGVPVEVWDLNLEMQAKHATSLLFLCKIF